MRIMFFLGFALGAAAMYFGKPYIDAYFAKSL